VIAGGSFVASLVKRPSAVIRDNQLYAVCRETPAAAATSGEVTFVRAEKSRSMTLGIVSLLGMRFSLFTQIVSSTRYSLTILLKASKFALLFDVNHSTTIFESNSKLNADSGPGNPVSRNGVSGTTDQGGAHDDDGCDFHSDSQFSCQGELTERRICPNVYPNGSDH